VEQVGQRPAHRAGVGVGVGCPRQPLLRAGLAAHFFKPGGVGDAHAGDAPLSVALRVSVAIRLAVLAAPPSMATVPDICRIEDVSPGRFSRLGLRWR
jgi:hypothetical protein